MSLVRDEELQLRKRVESELSKFLLEYPERYRDIDIKILAGKVLDPTLSFIITNLHDIQEKYEMVFFMRRSNLIEKHFQELNSIRYRGDFEANLKYMMVSLKQKKEMDENDLETVAEVDRQVSMQLDFMIKLGVPGFCYIKNESDEVFQQKLLNFIYGLIVDIEQIYRN